MNEIREFVKKVKSFYDRGIYKRAQIDAMLQAGKITREEYEYVCGVRE